MIVEVFPITGPDADYLRLYAFRPPLVGDRRAVADLRKLVGFARESGIELCFRAPYVILTLITSSEKFA